MKFNPNDKFISEDGICLIVKDISYDCILIEYISEEQRFLEYGEQKEFIRILEKHNFIKEII